MRTPGLADIAVGLTNQNNLRARYLSIWKKWLLENEGVIRFDEKGYNHAVKWHYVMSAVGGLFALIMSVEMGLAFNLLLADMIYVVMINTTNYPGCQYLYIQVGECC
ncbi:hypothetical protein RCL92_21525 [Escherichia coli]|nr:hypothetical protein [Escherichia coli]